MDAAEISFWDERYRQGRVSWDFHGVPMDASAFIKQYPPGRVLVPGCGSGHDVAAFHSAGWEVTGVEFSNAAIDVARSSIGSAADRIVLGDFFRVPIQGTFDIVYERAFLCAISPTLWPAYVSRVTHLLKPGGQLVGYFYYGVDDDPPPYPLTPQSANELFGQSFVLSADKMVADSVPLYAGWERWQQWRKSQ